MTSWHINNRSVSDPTYSFNEIPYASEALARAKFDQQRESAKVSGGSAQLVEPGGSVVASYSHWSEND